MSCRAGLTPLTDFSKNLTKNSNHIAEIHSDPAYKEWLFENKNPLYARYILRRSSRVDTLLMLNITCENIEFLLMLTRLHCYEV